MNASNCARPALRVLSATFLLLLSAAATTTVARAEDSGTEIQSLRREVEALRRRDDENRAKMAELERLLHQVLEAQSGAPASKKADPVADAVLPSSPSDALDRALRAPVEATTASTTAPASGAAPDRTLKPAGPSQPTVTATWGDRTGDIWSAPISGGAQARFIDISLNTLGAVGGSSVDDGELSQLEGGAHDPNENGFTLQQVELSLSGAVDPYFTGEAHIIATPGGVELEEAFFTTTALPFGFQLEAGYFFTEFGLMNPTHPHAWDWLDQPVVLTRMFGGEGMRSPGARLSWLMPTPFFAQLHVGVQNADEGELTSSFMGEEGVGGRPNVDRDVDSFEEMAWLGRLDGSWDLSRSTAVLLGTSVLYGPNATGLDGHTWIYGGDAKLRWRSPDNFRGWPFVVWQTEVIGRSYTADRFLAGTESGGDGGGGHVDDGKDDDGHDEGGGEEAEESSFPNDLPANTLHDIGFYTQLSYGFRYGWVAGFRAEYASGSGASVDEGVLASRTDDSLRDDRLRLSPLLTWHPTEFSRFRLQYNYDNADFLSGGDAHTVWLGGEVMYGKHAAHKY